MAKRYLTEEEIAEAGLPPLDVALQAQGADAARSEDTGAPPSSASHGAPVDFQPLFDDGSEIGGGEGGFTARDWARLALEVGVGTAAVVGSQGTATPAIAARLAPILGRLAPNVARAGVAGVGDFIGSLGAETFDPSEEPLKRAATTGLFGAAGEGVVGPALSKIFQGGTAKTLEKGGAEFVEEALGAGLTPSAGRASKNRAIDVAETISGASFFGGGKLAKNVEKVSDFFENVTREFVEKFRAVGSKEAVEDLASKAIEQSGEVWKLNGSALYGDMDRAIEAAHSAATRGVVGESIDTGVRAGVDVTPLLKRLDEAKGRGLEGRAAAAIERDVRERLREFGAGNFLPFKLAHEIRSDFLGIGRQSDALVAAKAPALGKELGGVLHEAMEAGAKRAGGDVGTLWKRADKFWREGSEVYNSSLLKALTRREPQSVFRAIERAAPRDIRRIRKVIDDPDLWQEIQGEFLLDTILGAEARGTKQLLGTSFAGRLAKAGNRGILKEMFSPQEVKRLEQLGRSLTISQGGIGKGIPGGIFIQLQQASTGVQALGVLLGMGGQISGSAVAGVLMAPAVAARVLTSPKFVRWATLGKKFKPGTKQAINAASQMMAIAIAEGGRTVSGDREVSMEELRSMTGGSTPANRSATFGGPGRATR